MHQLQLLVLWLWFSLVGLNYLAWNARYLFGTELHNSNLIAGVSVNIFSDEIDSGTLNVQKLSHSSPLDPPAWF
jgi:hypothetical protein